jgi:hypothetical protein
LPVGWKNRWTVEHHLAFFLDWTEAGNRSMFLSPWLSGSL